MKLLALPAALLAFSLALAVPQSVHAEQRTIEQITAAADKGDAEAQYRLGQAYAVGADVKKDNRKAYEYMQKAAEQGHADAIGGMGYFYANGFIVKKDLIAAAEWFRTGAEKGGGRSQLNYGRALLYGRGVEADQAEGLKWIQKAVDQGVPPAQAALAEYYFIGKYGVAQDYKKALEYAQKAADAGNAPAQNLLGAMYRSGQGLPMDLAKAEYWYRKAAEQGDLKGMSNLGQILGPDGPDATKHVEAMKWLLLAHRANEPAATNILNAILRSRPPEVVKEAQRQMNEFKPRRSPGSW